MITIRNVGTNDATLTDGAGRSKTLLPGDTLEIPVEAASDPIDDRIRALVAAKAALGAPVDPIDLVSVAGWIMSGEDPWSSKPAAADTDGYRTAEGGS